MHVKRVMAGKLKINLLVRFLLLLSLFIPTLAQAEPTFPNDPFKVKWQRADKPVSDGTANPARGWLWGPENLTLSSSNEPYAESPEGTRQVFYFDKTKPGWKLTIL